MKKLSLCLMLACSSAFAGDAPADKPPGGEMPERHDKPEGGTMSDRHEKAEGGEMSTSFGPNPNCTVDGTWHAVGPKNDKNPDGITLSSTFSGGTYSTVTPNGSKTSAYSVSGSNVTFSKGDMIKAPKGMKGEEKKKATCGADSTGTYEAQFSGNCDALKLVATSDTCEQRARVIQASTWHRGQKSQ